MKCEKCPGLRVEGYEYPESYCAAGVPENGKMSTDDGCRYTTREIIKRMERRDEMYVRQFDGIGDWYTERNGTETAMRTAIQKSLDEYRYGGLYLCFRNKEGRYYPICGDGKPTGEFAFYVMDAYTDGEKEVQLSFCQKCRWKNRTQKCACCRRNRSMKDNYEEALGGDGG